MGENGDASTLSLDSSGMALLLTHDSDVIQSATQAARGIVVGAEEQNSSKQSRETTEPLTVDGAQNKTQKERERDKYSIVPWHINKRFVDVYSDIVKCYHVR